jgi:hypothetical protein
MAKQEIGEIGGLHRWCHSRKLSRSQPGVTKLVGPEFILQRLPTGKPVFLPGRYINNSIKLATERMGRMKPAESEKRFDDM